MHITQYLGIALNAFGLMAAATNDSSGSSEPEPHVVAWTFLPNGSIVVSATDGIIYKSDNDGSFWKPLGALETTQGGKPFFFLDLAIGKNDSIWGVYAVVIDYDPRGDLGPSKVARSIDGGWTFQEVFDCSSPSLIERPGDDPLIVCGHLRKLFMPEKSDDEDLIRFTQITEEIRDFSHINWKIEQCGETLVGLSRELTDMDKTSLWDSVDNGATWYRRHSFAHNHYEGPMHLTCGDNGIVWISAYDVNLWQYNMVNNTVRIHATDSLQENRSPDHPIPNGYILEPAHRAGELIVCKQYSRGGCDERRTQSIACWSITDEGTAQISDEQYEFEPFLLKVSPNGTIYAGPVSLYQLDEDSGYWFRAW